MDSSAFHKISDKPMLLGECPLWHPVERVLYWIDITAHAVYRYDPATQVQLCWPLPSEPGCIAWRQKGGLIIAMRSGIANFYTDTGEVHLIAHAPYDVHAYRFNDGRCDAEGRLWTGTLVDARDKPSGSLYCFAEGQFTDFNHPVMVSNGVAFSPDTRTLYHADTAAHRISAYEFDVITGQPSNARLFHAFSGDKSWNYGGRPDGAAVDSEGAYWVAMYEGGQLLRLAPDGSILQSLNLPMRCPTMMAFGGDDMKTLFITSAIQKRSSEELQQLPFSGYVISTRVAVSGLPEHAYRD
jgi:sugar lactone lactonase YvrE